MEVTAVWIEVEADQTDQEGLAVFSQYLLTGMELIHCNFHEHSQLLHVGGGWL